MTGHGALICARASLGQQTNDRTVQPCIFTVGKSAVADSNTLVSIQKDPTFWLSLFVWQGYADAFRTSAVEYYDNEGLAGLVRNHKLRGDLVAA